MPDPLEEMKAKLTIARAALETIANLTRSGRETPAQIERLATEAYRKSKP